MSIASIPLTSKINITTGSHILYFYNDLQGYVENASSFILSGIQMGQHVIFIDSPERYQLILDQLGESLGPHQDKLQYIDHYHFYEMYGDFHFERVLLNLNNAINPYISEAIPIRLWGHVDWVDQPGILKKLHSYESQCDITISDLGFLTVCAYDGTSVPAAIQIEMMRSHEYLMTDHELVLSNLYPKNKLSQTTFPSLSVQSKIDTEMDLYKQKLDFVHVVSHEVRNPLTVIRAYASLLLARETDPEAIQKLEAIIDYVKLIDNELTHIINTEEMLTSEALWRKKVILVESLLEEVLSVMRVKARTQNINLDVKLDLPVNLLLRCNANGFKLIVSNLLSNAIKYSDEGGTVRFTAYATDKHLTMIVEDNGIGMNQEQVNMLFRKYGKINEEKSGQGIGLFMVKKLIENFEGEIEVDSQLYVGTTFTVLLPI
ncbi:MEDS domain-containing protein [Brevibacillus fulvus]|uniref:histidine kinase n=1 Tax=Brevibacillus fulvus TaxID=1125967 RepID=A0A939BQ08_9BACL|nr:MEDS domain-containing protein [Brevibacillus fulvus]MBM7591105.1 nitrogen-specific signal transduction histidine kinase [Brevibacillus fulvus]